MRQGGHSHRMDVIPVLARTGRARWSGGMKRTKRLSHSVVQEYPGCNTKATPESLFVDRRSGKTRHPRLSRDWRDTRVLHPTYGRAVTTLDKPCEGRENGNDANCQIRAFWKDAGSSMSSNPYTRPDFSTVTPYLIVHDAPGSSTS